MTKTQRVFAALVLAAGTTALTAPTADAVGLPIGPKGPSLLSQAEDLMMSSMPPERRSEVPRVSQQLGGLSGLHRLGELQQLVAPVAPVLGLVPGLR
ncbi:hypothetical protein AB0A69_19845 [Streptomyces sp. NPDC045431]|uniref:hypothetical protein n=1 Tax=Streptomyces sp. NPDC045431 TaxID=3155613 RepID=UPI003409052E